MITDTASLRSLRVRIHIVALDRRNITRVKLVHMGKVLEYSAENLIIKLSEELGAVNHLLHFQKCFQRAKLETHTKLLHRCLFKNWIFT